METPYHSLQSLHPSDPLLFLQYLLYSCCLPCVAMLALPTGRARSFPYLRGLVNTTLSPSCSSWPPSPSSQCILRMGAEFRESPVWSTIEKGAATPPSFPLSSVFVILFVYFVLFPSPHTRMYEGSDCGCLNSSTLRPLPIWYILDAQ